MWVWLCIIMYSAFICEGLLVVVVDSWRGEHPTIPKGIKNPRLHVPETITYLSTRWTQKKPSQGRSTEGQGTTSPLIPLSKTTDPPPSSSHRASDSPPHPLPARCMVCTCEAVSFKPGNWRHFCILQYLWNGSFVTCVQTKLIVVTVNELLF